MLLQENRSYLHNALVQVCRRQAVPSADVDELFHQVLRALRLSCSRFAGYEHALIPALRHEVLVSQRGGPVHVGGGAGGGRRRGRKSRVRVLVLWPIYSEVCVRVDDDEDVADESL